MSEQLLGIDHFNKICKQNDVASETLLGKSVPRSNLRNMYKEWLGGGGGVGLLVNILAFYTDHLSLNPAKAD